jgi:hypothetical protein
MIPQDFIQPQVDEFVNDYGLTLCVNDYNFRLRQGPVETNAVHNLFQVPFLKPVMVIINCVSNSTSHPPGLLLLNQGGGPTDWNVAINQWRAAIDSVQAPLPQLTNASLAGSTFQFTFPGQRGRTNQVQCSTNFLDWTVLTNAFGTNAPIVFRDTNALSDERRFYRVRRL